MGAHWKAYAARDGHYPTETQCFADPENGLVYLANELAGREADDTEGATPDPDDTLYWEMVEAYREGFEELGDRMADLTRGDKDPADWVGCGPAVLVVGFDYVIEGCDGTGCAVQEASACS